MSIQIVVESLFGNSDAVAAAIADGARATGASVGVTPVAAAPPELGPEVGLLVLGGPTHAFSMTRPSTRAEAHGKYGAPGQAEPGIREWIDRAVPRPDLPVVTFDTRVQVKLVPGSAAKSAASSLRHHGFGRAHRGKTFFVLGVEGPLAEGEAERARAWGAELAALDQPAGAPAD
ncbi:flavodoxin/nitric oxide synthase [Nocardioides sp.]|uniref:flavodoxin/nitric oxide synthase n=1 Tax=Nocardioides sp. TaxID=35761 RepID=UPI003528F3BF